MTADMTSLALKVLWVMGDGREKKLVSGPTSLHSTQGPVTCIFGEETAALELLFANVTVDFVFKSLDLKTVAADLTAAWATSRAIVCASGFLSNEDDEIGRTKQRAKNKCTLERKELTVMHLLAIFIEFETGDGPE